MDKEIAKSVRIFALDNARKYNGVPNMGSVIAKLIGERPEVKSQLKELTPLIKEICEEVKLLTVDKQVAELQKTAPHLLEEKKVEEKKLKPLPNATKGKIVMRLAPSPSGPLHIAHAVVFSLSGLYCKEYDGKLFLRIEDTNSENIYEPAYKMIENDTKWFTDDGIDKVIVQSDRLDKYYDAMEKLIEMDKAYVCTCTGDEFRAFSLKMKPCPCRDLPKKEHHTRWDRMFLDFKPGEAVVRIKTDIKDPNPAMRDWPAFRINDSVHPRQNTKYKVWPLMNFAVAIDDHETGVTHTIRGKDHMDNAKRQKCIYDAFGWKEPTHLYTGRINLEGLEISKTKVKAQIERGEYDDWDDIRLPFLGAMRRRGFQPGAFQKFAVDIGLGMNDKNVPADDFFKTLEAHNREIIDPIANRYFFVETPVEIKVNGAPKQTIEIPLHPENKKRGNREFETSDKFWVSKSDLSDIKAKKLFRLKDCLNFKKDGKGYEFDSVEYEKFRNVGDATFTWLPVDAKNVSVEVLMPDKKLKVGLGESGLKKLKVGDIVQFERFGFCRLDSKEKDKLTFWFAHK